MYTVCFDTVQGLRLSGLCLAAQRDGFSYTRRGENQGESSKWGGAFMLCLERRELSAQRKPNCPRWEVQKGGHEGHA